MIKKALLAIMLFAPLGCEAQMLSINDSKVKVELTAEDRTGTPKKGNPDGNFYSHEAVWYNPIFSPLQKLGIELHHQSNEGTGNGTWNHYFRFGVNGMKVFLLPEKTKGIAVTANLYGEASQHGVHHFDGVVSTIFMFKMGQGDSRGVGFVWLCNNPSKMFGLPIFTWQKNSGKHWSFNWMTWLGNFNYNFNENFCITGSYGFAFERYWIDHKGEINMANQIVGTPALSFQWLPSKHFTLGVSGGYQLAFMGSRFNAKGTEYLGKLNTRRNPFVSAKLTIRY